MDLQNATDALSSLSISQHPEIPKQPLSALQARSFLTSLLDFSLRITTIDKRVFSGQCVCLDKEGNIVLMHAYQVGETTGEEGDWERKDRKIDLERDKFLGTVIIGKESIVSVFIE